jgi:hypothetical protein
VSRNIKGHNEPHLKNHDFKVNDLENSPPPILKSWSRMYLAVIINLIFWLSTFYIIRRIFE